MPRFTDVQILKDLYLGKEADKDDDQLEVLLDSAETMFERGTNRLFSPDPALEPGEGEDDPATDSADPVVRRLSSGGRPPDCGSEPVEIGVPDLRELDTLTIRGVEVPAASVAGVWPLDGYELVRRSTGEPASGVLLPAFYLSTHGDWDVVALGRFGFLEVPGDVKDAVYLIAAKSFGQGLASYADQLITPEGDTLGFFRAMPTRAWAIYKSYWVPAP